MYNNQILINAHSRIQRRASKRQDNRPQMVMSSLLFTVLLHLLHLPLLQRSMAATLKNRKNAFNFTSKCNVIKDEGKDRIISSQLSLIPDILRALYSNHESVQQKNFGCGPGIEPVKRRVKTKIVAYSYLIGL